jgi:hypothetical protein
MEYGCDGCGIKVSEWGQPWTLPAPVRESGEWPRFNVSQNLDQRLCPTCEGREFGADR